MNKKGHDDKTGRQPIDGQILSYARRKKQLTIQELAKAVGVSDDAITRWGKSPKKPCWPHEENLRQLAKVLELPISAIEYRNAPKVRNCSGIWDLVGEDIVVVGLFEYPNGPKGLTARIKMEMENEATVRASGKDNDGDIVTMTGRVEEAGNHIAGTYDIENDRMRIYGTVVLEYLACGKRMKGFYLGREIGEGTTHILGRLQLSLVERLQNHP